jgi:DnaJ-domain-containing protein 1
MQDLYSILGVSRRANSAQIKAAYRLKAKLSHPDLHASDKEAEKRIQEINHAYTVLSNPKARAAYNFKLAILRMRARRRWSATAAAALAGFTIMMTTISLMWRREVGNPPLAGYQASQQNNSARDRSPIAETPESHANTTLETRHHKEVASSGELTSIPADQKRGKTEIAAILPPRLQTEEPAVPPPASVQEAAPQANSTGTEKLGQKRRDTRDINTNDVKTSDMKLPETKTLERARMAAKLQPTSRTNFERASLENRNTCSNSRSCSREVPPLFGVGF